MPGMPDQAMQGLMGAAPPQAEPMMGDEMGGDQIIAQVIELLQSASVDPQTKQMVAQKIMEALSGGMGGGAEAPPMEGMV